MSLSAVINSNVRVASQQRCLIAQKLPYFNDVHMDNECVLTCTGQHDGLGGILAFRARSLFMYGKIDMTGKGTEIYGLQLIIKRLHHVVQFLRHFEARFVAYFA